MPGKDQWAAKSLRSGFGHQCTSNKPSSPGYGFGSSVRDAFGKQYSSAEADKAKVRSQGGDNLLGAAFNVPSPLEKQVTSEFVSPPRVSFGTSKRAPLASPTAAPGPGQYKIKSTVGESVESRKASAPRMRFTTASRDAADKMYISSEHEKAVVGNCSPGPGMYTISGGMGKQQLSTKKTLPSCKMGTGARFASPEMREAASMPGAGAYDVPNTLGSQTSPTARGSPKIKFGTSTRDKDAKVFISVEHEKNLYGTQSPGPSTASPASALGKQKLSTKANSPTVSFGSGKRVVEQRMDVPGPGAYYA